MVDTMFQQSVPLLFLKTRTLPIQRSTSRVLPLETDGYFAHISSNCLTDWRQGWSLISSRILWSLCIRQQSDQSISTQSSKVPIISIVKILYNQVQAGYPACKSDIQNGDYSDAFNDCTMIFDTLLGYLPGINYYGNETMLSVLYQHLYQTSERNAIQLLFATTSILSPVRLIPAALLTYFIIPEYLNSPAVQKQLGVNITWESCNMNVYAGFENYDFENSYT